LLIEISVLSAIHIADNDGVTFFKTCTAEVFRPVPILRKPKPSVIETRKDFAVHVSLSSSKLVKQPGAMRHLSEERSSSKGPPSPEGERLDLIFLSEGHQAAIRRSPAPRRERTSRPPEGRKQPLFSEFFVDPFSRNDQRTF